MQEFIKPLAELGEQGHQVHHRDRHQGASRTPTKSAPPRSTTCASRATWCSATSSRAWRKVALREAVATGDTDPFYVAKLQTARFYFAKLLPETATLMRTARAGVEPLMDTDAALV